MFAKNLLKKVAGLKSAPFMSKGAMIPFNQARSFAIIKKFTESHEWLEYDTETKLAKIGITDHAQHELSEVVYVEMPDQGTEFSKGDVISTIESTKTAADIYQMIDGEVVKVNEDVRGDPALVNDGAENNGWIMQVHVNDES